MNENFTFNFTEPAITVTQESSTLENNILREQEIRLLEVILTCIILGFASFAGTIMNAVVMCAIIGSKKLRRPADGMIVATALNEFVLCSFFYPIHFYETINGQDKHLEMLCNLDAIFLPLSVYQTISMFPVIAYNRFSYVAKQRHVYNNMFSMPKVVLYVIMSWVFPFVCMGIPILVSEASVAYSEVYRICIITETAVHAYMELLYFVVFYILTIIPYFKLFTYIRTHVADRNRRQAASNGIHASSRKMGSRAVRMIGVVSFGFGIFYSPYLFFRAIDPCLVKLSPVLHRITLGILSLGGFINPLLFLFTNSWHQLAIKGLLHCKSPDTFIPSNASQ